jgi:CRP/FNR family cyclic AMP-dependent transcriptional regulator
MTHCWRRVYADCRLIIVIRQTFGKKILQNAEELLRTSLWGQSLTADEMSRALAGTCERAYAAGAFICMKGDPVDSWMGIIDGLGKMASHWTTGKTTSLTGISAGGWFGEGSLLKEEPRRYDVMALRETRVAFMNRSTFLWLMDHSIPFNRYLITQLNERLGQFIGMMENERLLDPDARIARCLAGLFNPVLYPGTNRLLQISQEELGYLAGVSRQRANQGLKALEDAGLVRSEYGGINVLNLDGLRHFGD